MVRVAPIRISVSTSTTNLRENLRWKSTTRQPFVSTFQYRKCHPMDHLTISTALPASKTTSLVFASATFTLDVSFHFLLYMPKSTPSINLEISLRFFFFRSSPRSEGFPMHLLQLGATRVRLAGAVQPHRNYLRPFLSSVVAIEVRSIILNCLAFKQISIAPNIVRVGFL